MWLGLLALHTSRRSVFAFAPIASASSRHITTRLFADKAPRHDVRSGGSMEMDPEEQKIQEAFAEHQQNAPKMDWAQDIRTLVQYNHGFAVMSTNSKS
jgi:hypothetical protein